MAFRIGMATGGDQYINYCREHGLDVVKVDSGNDEESTIRKLKGLDGCVAGAEIFSPRVLEALKDTLKIIVRHGVGYDLVDVDYAAKLGICSCNTPGTMSTGVAETALTMMLELSRRFYQRNAAMQKDGSWDRGEVTPQFEGCTIGLVGFGNIAQCLARYLVGFTGCKVLAYDINYNEEALKKYNVKKASLDEIARESDFVSVHVPMSPDTEKIISAGFLAKMKPTACLINTSRGGTVDEAALIDALRNKTIAGAGLDVYETEPADPKNPLFSMENVYKTPHIATYTHTCIRAGFDGVIKCMKEFIAGEIPEFTLNRDYINHVQK